MFINPLSGWINGNHSLPIRFYGNNHIDKPTNNWSIWLTLEEKSPLYLAGKLKWISLKDSRQKTKVYLNEASEIINGLNGGWLDSEEQQIILNKIGEPPLPCLPIYLITLAGNQHEKVAYVGKTKSSSRFSSGHFVGLDLHNPIYKEYNKHIYRCSIWFYFNGEYIVLDWIQPEFIALQLLDSIESQLIYYFQPELNTNKKKRNHTQWSFYIHIQNFNDGKFLHDTFV